MHNWTGYNLSLVYLINFSQYFALQFACANKHTYNELKKDKSKKSALFFYYYFETGITQ